MLLLQCHLVLPELPAQLLVFFDHLLVIIDFTLILLRHFSHKLNVSHLLCTFLDSFSFLFLLHLRFQTILVLSLHFNHAIFDLLRIGKGSSEANVRHFPNHISKDLISRFLQHC